MQGLEETIVPDKNEVYEILERGRTKRQTAATLMNAHSRFSFNVYTSVLIMVIRQKRATEI